MPPADVGAEVGRKSTVVVGTGATAADEAGKWDRGGTPSDT
jgi:hypothetical protein